MDKLPPVMLTAGVLFVPPGLLLRVIEELPLDTELIPFKFLFNLISNVSVPLATTAMLPAADAKLGTAVAATPSPWTFTREPSLWAFSVPVLLPVNFKPLSTNASDVVLRSFTFTAAFGVLVAAVSNLVKNVSPVDVPVLSIAEPTLLTMELPPVTLPAASWMDVITSDAATSVPSGLWNLPSLSLVSLLPALSV